MIARARRFTRPLAVALAALTVAGGAVACTSQDTLAVCTSIPYEPFEYKDSWQDNKVVGFDVDLMNLVADELGQELQIVDMGFGPITSGQALDAGECDVAAAALTITQERSKVMDFSQPYYNADQGLAAVPGTGVSGLGDMDGKLLGVQTETTGEAYALEKQGEYGYEIKPYSDLGELQEALVFGVIDGAIGDIPLWNSEAARNPDRLGVVDRFDTGEQYGFAVAKGNDDLMGTINDVLTEAKESGEFAAIYERWINEPWPGN
ncbi:polar amino acid transport system substrate-binding protein [Stackebrandtia albiflava]|uniref:Polar amino acid transport system substrate-binding protein n=1 Tax=Stackebrandtia albiflava TaxID=406432 RepID=A0A562UY20_9ACTN|nr:transporter substrate-binding domain-containing protein [Stackebrandtia albiflava]TWJ10540.1 polar amino acid transport system substrate-binding protein [Stackebrandtia albiflava]